MPEHEQPSPPKADRDLISQGWERRFMGDPSRVEEGKELYESMGFEVQVVLMAPSEFPTACGDCPDLVCEEYAILYTRKPGEAPQSGFVV
ncbi:MAG: hypothetical protein HOM34_09875 [Planctomycetes bacterium]|jgi:hypothetical protein|nr:hypothetical protein [Planctomycetota bacterium]MBT4029415.1 hypothetical protein [Planctomycetota bacterium]MBT4561239.1 hypothetical protein [Planctomycetota bacterium]MBT5102400.1 hypothetical protein [Planctomycetota bacterium]MBT5121016.1 hypothetical protein [Planctomycetota bacterium]